MHIGFFHLTDYGHLREKKILNIAMDIEINQYIERSWLPDNGCFLETFNEQGMNLEERKGTRYYYDALMQEKDSGSELGDQLQEACNGDGQAQIVCGDGTEIDLPDHNWDDVEQLDEATQKLIKAQTGHILKQVACLLYTSPSPRD